MAYRRRLACRTSRLKDTDFYLALSDLEEEEEEEDLPEWRSEPGSSHGTESYPWSGAAGTEVMTGTEAGSREPMTVAPLFISSALESAANGDWDGIWGVPEDDDHVAITELTTIHMGEKSPAAPAEWAAGALGLSCRGRGRGRQVNTEWVSAASQGHQKLLRGRPSSDGACKVHGARQRPPGRRALVATAEMANLLHAPQLPQRRGTGLSSADLASIRETLRRVECLS